MSLLWPGSKKSQHSIPHYDIQVDINARTMQYSASAHVNIVPSNSTTAISLLLNQKCKVSAVNYLGLPLTYSTRTKRQEDLQQITCHLPRRIRAGEKLILHMLYTGPLTNCTRQVVQLAPQDFWYPFTPGQSYTSSIKVTLPAAVKVVASGEMVEEKQANTRFQSTWEGRNPASGLHVLAGKFNRSQQDNLAVYYPKQLLNQARAVKKYGPVISQLLDNLLGPAAVSANYVVLTEENIASCTSSYITILSQAEMADIERESESPVQRNQALFFTLAQKLARQRLRCQLSTSVPAETWYLEALAQYCSWLTLEDQYGEKEKIKVMLAARQLVIEDPPPPLNKMSGGIGCIFPENAIAKATWIHHMVHNLLGDGFFPAVRQCLESHIESAPSTRDFFQEIGRANQFDMAGFFREWVEKSLPLKLVVEEPRTFLDDDGVWQLVFLLANKGKLRWPLPVDITLTLEDGSTEQHSRTVSAEPYLFSTHSRVVRIEVDKKHRILNWAEQKTYEL